MVLRIIRAVPRPGGSTRWLAAVSELAEARWQGLDGLVWLIIGIVPGEPDVGMVTSVWRSWEAMRASVPTVGPGWPDVIGELVVSWSVEMVTIAGRWATD